MTVLSAQSIRRRVRDGRLAIRPFHERQKAFGLSYGLSSCGYDIRLAQSIILFPFWGRLASALEYIAMPNDLRGRIDNKSTNARLFIDASRATNLEPGWRGHLTLELTHDRPWPVRLPAGYPIAQIVFEKLDEATEQPYGASKYQDQPSRPVPARFEVTA